METRAYTAAAAVLAASLAASCAGEVQVKDHSFDYTASMEYSDGDRCHYLWLTLVEGDAAETYTLDYLLDGSLDNTLRSAGGGELPRPAVLDFRGGRTLKFRTSPLETGLHGLDLELATGRFTLKRSLEFATTAQPFRIHAEVKTAAGDRSSVLATLLEGDSRAEYRAEVSLDGRGADTTYTLDFGRSPIAEFLLPVMRPGGHRVTLKVSDGRMEQEDGIDFTEPVRHPVHTLELRLTPDGAYVLESEGNPYGLSFSGTARLEMEGSVSYRPDEGYRCEELPFLQTDTLSRRAERGFSNAGGLLKGAAVMDRDSLASLITGRTAVSASYQLETDQDGYFLGYIHVGNEAVPYSLTREEFSLTLSAERVDGVRTVLRNRAGRVTVNGETVPEGAPAVPVRTDTNQKTVETCGS